MCIDGIQNGITGNTLSSISVSLANIISADVELTTAMTNNSYIKNFIYKKKEIVFQKKSHEKMFVCIVLT